MRTPALLVGLAVVAAAALAPAVAAAPVTATLTATTKAPVVDQPWKWTLTVKNTAGKPVRATAQLQILVAGAVVGCWRGGQMAPCTGSRAGDTITFTGRRTGVIRWPAEARGVTLTFQAVVKAAGVTKRLRYPVTVR
jgi:hypothetical protein